MSGGAFRSPGWRWWALAGCALLGCAGGAAGGASVANGGPASGQQPFGKRCTAQPSQSRDGMRVSCDDDAIVFIVPGTDWSVEASPSPSVIVFASSGPLNLSVRVADESESRYDVHEHLEAILNGVSDALAAKGHRVSAPHFEETRTGAVVLRYEVAVAAEGGEALRMVNAWNAVHGEDGRYLDYHVSFAATLDDPAWKPEPGSAGPRERVVDLASAFAVRGGR